MKNRVVKIFPALAGGGHLIYRYIKKKRAESVTTPFDRPHHNK
ncbi:MAG: hypothetical protein ACYDHC_13975 [Desulfuromonadaceae bacterium]